MSENAVAATFVFPCLNEAGSVAACIRRVHQALESTGVTYEIVVADNGSTDESAALATAAGARVVPVAERGYGAALRGGIAAAAGEFVFFADADGTYLYEDAPKLLEAVRDGGCDMAIASRLCGVIEPGAMPFLHRYLGTPVLTALINLFFGGRLSDCNSGFRCFRKSSYEKWSVRASGMEFASELLIKALKAGSKMAEIPSGLRRDLRDREAHLRTWRDGMRHLLFIFSEKPSLFEHAGLLLLAGATLIQVLAMAIGPANILGFNVFDLHTRALALLLAMAGAPLYVLALSLYIRSGDKPLAMSRGLLHMDEGVLFFGLVVLFGALACLIGYVGAVWFLSDFRGLHFANLLVSLTHMIGISLTLGLGLLGVHTLKKAAV